jgi:PAS domain S-box-containing protein
MMEDAVIGTDRDGTIRVMNAEAEAITGWPAEAAAGRALSEVFRVNGDTLLTRDRRVVPIEGRAEAVRDDDGGLREILIHFSQQLRNTEAEPPLDAA